MYLLAREFGDSALASDFEDNLSFLPFDTDFLKP
jgi:hypothetical protein